MSRKWIKGFSPRFMNKVLGAQNGAQWNPQLDVCWNSDDGEYSVCSRLLKTAWGEVEHVTIQRVVKNVSVQALGNGNPLLEISWAEKQAIKDEIFGTDRVAIEVFPTADRMVDQSDIYHLWVFEKGFQLPFGIHPFEFDEEQYIERDYNLSEEEVKTAVKTFEGVDIEEGALERVIRGGNRRERREAKKRLPKDCVYTGLDLCQDCNCMVNVFMDNDGNRYCGKGKHKMVKRHSL